MGKIQSQFKEFLAEASAPNSGMLTSYMGALKHLGALLQNPALGFTDLADIWKMHSPERLAELYKVLLAKPVGFATLWRSQGLPKSYWDNGYCSAALAKYHQFLVEQIIQEKALQKLGLQCNEQIARYQSNMLPDNIQNLTEGKETEAKVKVRVNQKVFRRNLLKNYSWQCCISGLNVPAVLRASHIIGWAERKATQLDPRNGLCLSATYDAAFDQKMFTLDDDYRVVLSKDLKGYTENQAYNRVFKKVEGQKIALPTQYLPLLEYLEEHRSSGRF